MPRQDTGHCLRAGLASAGATVLRAGRIGFCACARRGPHHGRTQCHVRIRACGRRWLPLLCTVLVGMTAPTLAAVPAAQRCAVRNASHSATSTNSASTRRSRPRSSATIVSTPSSTTSEQPAARVHCMEQGTARPRCSASIAREAVACEPGRRRDARKPAALRGVVRGDARATGRGIRCVYTQLAGQSLYGLLAREFAPLPDRLRSVTARLEQMPRLLEQTRANLVPERVPVDPRGNGGQAESGRAEPGRRTGRTEPRASSNPPIARGWTKPSPRPAQR